MYVKFYHRMGKPLGQVVPTSAARSWRLNEIGKAVIEIPRTSTKITPAYLRYGNLVAIDSDDTHLWAGILLPPTTWSEKSVILTAYSGERLLKGRLLQKNYYALGARCGEVFQHIINWIRNVYQPNISVGNINYGGPPVDKEYHYDDAWQAITDLARQKGNEFWIEPFFNHLGWLMFRANWYKRRGADKSGKIALIENVNLVGQTTLREGGEIFNHWVISGAGDSWQTMPVGEYHDLEQTDAYGKWSAYSTMSDIISVDSLAEHAHAKVDDTKYAESLFRTACVNMQNLWHKFQVGDTVKLESHTFGWDADGGLGFKGKARVISQAVDELQGYMALVLSEVKE